MELGFNLREIKIEQFATFSEYLNNTQAVNVGHAFEFMLLSPVQQLGVFATFTFVQDSTVIMKLQVSCHFGIAPPAWQSFWQGEQVIFPKDFVTNLASITTGVARGVLVAKTEHNILSKYLIPLLDITNIITHNLHFDIR